MKKEKEDKKQERFILIDEEGFQIPKIMSAGVGITIAGKILEEIVTGTIKRQERQRILKLIEERIKGYEKEIKKPKNQLDEIKQYCLDTALCELQALKNQIEANKK